MQVNIYELQLNDGIKYLIKCTREEIVKLMKLLGDKVLLVVEF